MEALNVVRGIIARVSDEEKAVIRTYLSVFGQGGKPGKSVKVFDILCADLKGTESEQTSPRELENLLYGKSSSANFSRLLYRMRDKILEAMIIDVNIEREGAYDAKSRVNMEIRKNLMQVQLLQSRGLADLAQTLLAKIIEQAKRYESYEELLIAIRLHIDLNSADTGDKHLAKWLALYERYDNAKNAVIRAEVNRIKVHATFDRRASRDPKLGWLKRVLDQMSTDYKKTASAQVGFYYFYVLAQYHQSLREFQNARRALLDILKLLEVSPSIYTKIRVGNVMLNLADNDLYLRDFTRSYRTAADCLRYFKETSFNHTQGIELMFYAKFYLGDYESAKEILVQLLPDSDETTGTQYRIGKRLFLLACTCFMLKDYTSAFKLTNKPNSITDDKEGWNIGIRILSIVSLIELGKPDLATARISALKIFIDTLNKKDVSQRMQLIALLLRKLSNAAFNFKAAYHKDKAQFDELEKISWTPKSPEMVIFHQWFLAKMLRQPFAQTIPGKEKEFRAKKVLK